MALVEVLAAPPDLTEAERTELYLLRRHFRITAYEARHVVPGWEIDLLLDGLVNEVDDG